MSVDLDILPPEQDIGIDPDLVLYGKTTYDPKSHCCLNLIPSLGLEDFTKGNTYRAGLVEFVGSVQFVLGSCLIANGCVRSGVAYPGLYSAILHIFLFMFLISSTIPGSGGHLNPLVTMACVFARIMTVSKCLVYLVCQIAGATLAGFIARLMLGEDIAITYGIGQCTLGDYGNQLGSGAAFLVEFCFSFLLLFVIYGMVIDPRQNETAGPILGPLVVSLVFCFLYAVSALIRPSAGYPGAALNPSRCLGPAIAMGNLQDQWVFWIPDICAAILHGALYILVPPYHETLYGKLETKRKDKQEDLQ